jgi:hypothetical protein
LSKISNIREIIYQTIEDYELTSHFQYNDNICLLEMGGGFIAGMTCIAVCGKLCENMNSGADTIIGIGAFGLAMYLTFILPCKRADNRMNNHIRKDVIERVKDVLANENSPETVTCKY